jgi:hypothetical protein
VSRRVRVRRPSVAEWDQGHADALDVLREARSGFLVCVFDRENPRALLLPAPWQDDTLVGYLEQLIFWLPLWLSEFERGREIDEAA